MEEIWKKTFYKGLLTKDKKKEHSTLKRVKKQLNNNLIIKKIFCNNRVKKLNKVK